MAEPPLSLLNIERNNAQLKALGVISAVEELRSNCL